MIFFFFKQKTAYEMRISDWSSDVCSSDLRPLRWVFSFPDRRKRHTDPLTSNLASMTRHFLNTQDWTRAELDAVLAQAARFKHGPAGDAPKGRPMDGKIGRASCRERVCQYVSISVAAGSLKKTKPHNS